MGSENRRPRRAGSQQRPLTFDSDDNDDLREAIEASEKEHETKEIERRRREEELVVQEAADEAAAIAESERFAGIETEAQRREAAAEAEFERILKESAAEAKKNKAAEEEELARLHATFGNGVRSTQTGRPSNQSPAPRASHGRLRTRSDTAPPTSAGSTSEQRGRAQTTAQNPPSRNSSTSTASSGEARPRGGNLLSRALNSVRRPFGRSDSNSSEQPRTEIRPQDIPEPPRATASPPLPIIHSPVRSHSERTPPARNQIGRRSPSSLRPPHQATNRRERLDAQMREALNSSHRHARIEERYGDLHSRREDEMLRRAMEQSLGDAPPPPDPSEGLIDPPPGYEDIHRDRVLDPRRYTTTNVKGNEPGYQQVITPEIRKVMKKWLAELQKFDAKSKATGKDQPPVNNAFAKKRPDAEPTSADTSTDANSDGADDLQALLGGHRPAPAPPVQAQTVAANAFMSRMPGLATDARSRIPTARPWDNAFSRLPTARPAGRAREGERRSGL